MLFVYFAMFDIVRLYFFAYYDSGLGYADFPVAVGFVIEYLSIVVTKKSNPPKGILAPLSMETFVNVKPCR